MKNMMLTALRLSWMVSIPVLLDCIRAVSTDTVAGPCTMQVNGGVINLWSVGKQNFPPRWSNQSTLNKEMDPGLYSFDPCYPFSIEGECQDSLVCRNVSNNFTSIGLAGQSRFVLDEVDESLVMRIEGREKIGEINQVTEIHLKCDKYLYEDALEVIGKTQPGVYSMTLTSRCCCPGVCHGQPIERGLSFGSVLCIIFVCAVVVYLVGGVLYMKIVRGASGIEVIPNSGFWLDFPHLVAEGFNFVLTCGKGPESLDQGPGSGSRSDYESI